MRILLYQRLKLSTLEISTRKNPDSGRPKNSVIPKIPNRDDRKNRDPGKSRPESPEVPIVPYLVLPISLSHNPIILSYPDISYGYGSRL